MTWFFVILAIAVITFIFMAVLSPLGELPPAEADLRPDEVDGAPVFDVVVRGYRMDEVDERITSLQSQIDELNAELGRAPEQVAVTAIEQEPVQGAAPVADRTDPDH